MKIFTDASLDDKRKIAGVGIYIVKGASNRTISHWIKCENVNFAELWAIYQAAILGFGKDCTIYTDSLTAIQYIEGKENNEKPRTKEQYIRHKQLQLLAYKVRRLKPHVEWTRGHRQYFQENAIGNQIADNLSKQARAKYYALTKGR